MYRKMVYAALAAAAVTATPSLAADKLFNLGAINPGQAATAQFIHYKRGNTNSGSAQTEVYASSNKAFSDTVNFQIAENGTGNGVFQIQFLRDIKGVIQKNISNAKLTLLETTSNSTLFDNVTLTSGTPFLIPFIAGVYEATISGNASGRNGGDYQVTFAAPVPEPAVVGSMGAGLALAGLVAMHRRRKVTLVKA